MSRPADVFVASGHGGDDPGTVDAGLVERDLNAAVAARLVARLREHGLDARTDLDHGNPGFPAEAELAHALGGARYYVALHHNHHHSTARGTEAFGRPGEGAAFARSLLDELVAALRTLDRSLPDRGVRPDAGTGATKHLDAAPGCAAVVELCFLSSADDRALVADDRYVDLAAEALCRAIVDHGRVDGAWTAVHDRGGASALLPPVASVVVPTIGRGDLLAQAVESVLAQTVRGVEVLVVDDAADPPVPGFDDDRVRVVRLDARRGPGGARNAGIAAATGRLLAFLDDDDLWVPHRLDLALAGLRRAPVAVCGTQHLGAEARPARRLEGRIGDAVLHGTTPCLGATALRREVAPDFDERWSAVEDVEWWWRLARLQAVTTVDEVGYLVRLHDGVRGENPVERRVAENLALLREHRAFFARDRRAAAHRWLRVGVLAEQVGDRRTAVAAYARHLRLQPGPRAAARVVRAAVRVRGRVGPRRSRRDPDGAATGAVPPAARPLRTTHLLMSDRARGAEQAARFLADALDDAGEGNRVVALKLGDGSGGRVDVDGALLGARGRHVFRSRLPLAVWRLRRELANHPADVVLAHGAGPAAVAALASLCPLPRRRTGGHAARPGRRPFPPIVWQRILVLPSRHRWHPTRLAWRFVARRVDGVVALTEATGHEVRSLGFHGPVWLVPNHRPAAPHRAVDREVERRRLRRELGIPADAPIVAFVGHLVAQKDPLGALDVLAAVRGARPAAHVVVVGDGPRRRAVEARAAELGPGVHVLGHRDDVHRVLAAVDVLVSTSVADSMPGVVVEAQLAGCPVVARCTDGIRNALVDGCSGTVVASGEVDELAAAVVALLDDGPARTAMAAAARAHGATLATGAVAVRYRQLLRSLASRGAVRVLHVLPDLGTGGAERALAVLARHADPSRCTQLVVTLRGDRRPRHETVAGELDALGIGRADLHLPAAPSRNLLALALGTRRLARLARRWRADVVDAALLDASLVARAAPLPPGARRVSHLVNTPWEPEVHRAAGGPGWRRAALRAADRWTARRDDALVALTGAVAGSAERHLGRATTAGRLLVLPRGVDLDAHPALDPASGDASPLRVVAVGRFVPQKGHETLVGAVALLRARRVEVTLTIVGEGPGRDAVEKLAADLGVGDAVVLPGAHADVRPFLAAADVFALASRWEGQSNAVLEAMASARPVVVGDVPALREVVGDAGVLVPPDDVRAWADALQALAADGPRRAALATAARRRVEARYDARARAADLVALYEHLLAR